MMGLYLGLGAEDLSRRFLKSRKLSFIWIVVPMFFLILNYSTVDRSNRVLHARIVERVLSYVERDAVIVVDDYDYGTYFWYYLLGEDYGKKNLFAFPVYFAGPEGIKAYLRNEADFKVYPTREPIPIGYPVYALWVVGDEMREEGFVLKETGIKYIYKVELPEP